MCLALLLGGLAMYWAAQTRDRDTLDARLEHMATAVMLFFEHEIEEGEISSTETVSRLRGHATESTLYRYQVWTRDGFLVLRSNDASETTPLVELARTGYASIQIDDEEYRVLAMASRDGGVIVQVAECIDERETRLGLVTLDYMAFLLPPFGLALGATGLMLRRSFSSLSVLADHLRHRSPLDITRPAVAEPPQELQPVLQSLDALIDRFGHALAVERRFTAVAAHELRTPLAGIRAQAQLAATAPTTSESNEALNLLMSGVDRAARVLEQLLDLARLESMGRYVGGKVEWVDVSSTYQDVMGELGPKALARRIILNARFGVDRIQGLEFPFYILMRNLVANAIQYSPAGGRVLVMTGKSEDGVVLTVDDSGPGISVAARDRAFERFNRLGQSETEGAGLGLSIVAQVVELHHAEIHLLDSPLGGLRVQVLFGHQGAPSSGDA